DGAGDEPEGRARLEVRARRRRRVQHVEQIHVDIEAPSAAVRESLGPAQVQNVLRRELLAPVRLEPDRGVAVLCDRRSAVRIGLTEDVRSLPLHAVLALKESGYRHVSRKTIAAADVAGPRPGLVERGELV